MATTTDLSRRPALASLPEAPSGTPISRRRLALIAAAFAALVVLRLVLPDGVPRATEAHYGIASTLPPLLTLVLVFITRQVILSLLLGIVAGGILVGQWNVLEAFLFPSVGTPSFALILVVYLWALGGLVGIWSRTGGAHYFARWAARHYIGSPRSAKVFTWLMGMLLHQGGTTSIVITGTTVRSVADEQRVSHEETSFLVDTTGSPVASILALNAWPIYVAGLVAGTVPFLATRQDAILFYFRAIPFNFYAIAVVLCALLLALEALPWINRRMRLAMARARETGEVDGPHARPLAGGELGWLRVVPGYPTGLLDFLLPIGVLVGVVIVGLGWGFLQGGLAGVRVPVAEAFALAVVSAVAVTFAKGLAFSEILDGFVDGVKGVTIGAVLIALALTVGEVTRSMGTAAYIIDVSANLVYPVLLPTLLFLVAVMISFATGMSWGTYPVTLPIALPLSYAIFPDPTYVALCFGAVVGGGVFGDHTSPLSDTTILSCLTTGADLMDHANSQLPLALACVAISAVLYLVGALLIVGGA